MADKRAAAKAKAEEAQARLAAEVERLSEDGAWTAYLQAAARFHTYSWGNVLLIQAQCPGATRVAGFRTWQSMGRQVRKGETGLRILAPRTGPCRDCGGTGEGCTRCGGRGRYLFFTTATVFDVSQTDGDPLPEPPVRAELLTGGDPAGLFDTVRDALLPDGWTVTVGDAGGGGVNGYCNHGTRSIVVEAERDPAQQVKTLVHELAHASLHAPDACDYRAERGRLEVEAESVAYVVLNALGVDTEGYSLGYVAGWSDGDAEVVRATAQRVLGEARRMLDALVPADEAAEPVAA